MGMRFDPAGPYAVGHADVEYARRDGEPLLARVYRPEGVAGSWPILVDVHGGAWSAFDRRADANFDRALAACGMVVIALDFRQAPAHRWPTAAVDVAEGVRWAKRHAAEFDASPERLGIVGGSSGGHLAVAVALQARSREPAFAGDASPARVGSGTDAGPDASMAGADEGAEGIDASVDYAMPLWPILDPLARYRYLLERRARPEWVARDPFFQLERLIAAHDAFFGDEATMARASVQRMIDERDFGALPRIWIAHPELDENVTRAMTDRFVAAYRDAGGEIELEVFAGVGHAFANFPGEAADRCIERMRLFVARTLARPL